MAGALLSGGAVGALCGELLKLVLREGKKNVMFKSELKRIETTLISIKSAFDEIEKLNSALDRPKEDTDMFVRLLRGAKDLILECSTIKSWNLVKRSKYAKKLIKMDISLLRFFQIDVQAQLACDVRKTLVGVSALVLILLSSNNGGSDDGDASCKLARMLSILKKRGGFAGSCGVPGLLDLVVSPLGGSGKATVVQAHDKIQDLRFNGAQSSNNSATASMYVVCRTFELTVISAHDVEDVRRTLKLEVYAKIQIGADSYTESQTAIDESSGKNPSWNCRTVYTITEVALQKNPNLKLVITLYAARSLKRDKYISEVSTSIKGLLEGGNSPMTLQLVNKSRNTTGSLTFSYEFGEPRNVKRLSFIKKAMNVGGSKRSE